MIPPLVVLPAAAADSLSLTDSAGAAQPLALTVPAPNQVHLRLVSLNCPAHELERLQGFLTGDELQRCNRLIDRERRDRAVAGRGLLREILAGYLGEKPEELLLSEGEFGKLHLSDHLESDSISFNLSHAGNHLLLAVCVGCEVGVDMELVQEDLDFRPMAERYFSERERRELFSLPEDGQRAAFYRCWTRKEAYLKGTGTGFSQAANAFDVSLLPLHPAELLEHRGAPAEVERWSIRDVELPGGFCAAVAIEGENPELKTFFATETRRNSERIKSLNG
jgi:4'-phosphopantetheinyl transferase